ncbi:MAG: retinol dehydrogenase [Sandaracinaceae bacterium]
MFIGLVVNPRARKNRGAPEGRVARLRRALGEHGVVRVTTSTDALDDALDGLLGRCTHLVSDGGDGALNWLLDAVRARVPDPRDWPAFVPTNGGTIDFVARKAGVRGQALGIAEALARAASDGRAPRCVELDSLAIRGETLDGAPFDRVGFALAAGGIGNRFFDKYYDDPEPRPATIVRVIARSVGELALSQISSSFDGGYASHVFAPTLARVAIDGEELPHTRHAGIHAGAFDVNLGGVLRVFPFARPAGQLHFQAGALSPMAIVANLPAIAAGGAIRGPQLRDTVGRTMRVEALGEPLRPILDGERFEGLRVIEVGCGPNVRVAVVDGR